jgi:hypothetical protein
MNFLKVEQTDELWVQKDGTSIPVGLMEVHHLKNALRKMIKWRNQLQKNMEALKEEETGQPGDHN